MSTAEQLTAIRADIKRLKELTQVQDQLLASKDAHLASKDQVIACKSDLIVYAAEELQQYKSGQRVHSGAAVTAPGDRAAGACNGVREQQHSSSPEEPLEKDDILDHIFGFVGGGDHLYTAGVSRRWRGRYLRHCVLNCTHKREKKHVTRHRSVVMTADRLKLALSSGLSVAGWAMSTPAYAELIGKHSTEP
jgi:hypothetical protein